jgi:hypothetical protein
MSLTLVGVMLCVPGPILGLVFVAKGPNFGEYGMLLNIMLL